MIEPLDRISLQDLRNISFLYNKINEIIEVVNGTYLPAALETTEAKEPYCPQAEEALKQVAILEHVFNNHHHAHGEMSGFTSGPIVTMVDESKDQL